MSTPALYLPIKTTIELHLETVVIPRMLTVLEGAGIAGDTIAYSLRVKENGYFDLDFSDRETQRCFASISTYDLSDDNLEDFTDDGSLGEPHLRHVLKQLCMPAGKISHEYRLQQQRLSETKIRSYV